MQRIATCSLRAWPALQRVEVQSSASLAVQSLNVRRCALTRRSAGSLANVGGVTCVEDATRMAYSRAFTPVLSSLLFKQMMFCMQTLLDSSSLTKEILSSFQVAHGVLRPSAT